jgi:hypothetical protein
MWGAFWLAYGILNILLAAGALTAPTPWYHNPELGFWFFALGAITASGALASLAESVARMGRAGREDGSVASQPAWE